MKAFYIALVFASIAMASLTVGDAETGGMDPFCAS